MDELASSTRQKALALNRDATTSGTFAFNRAPALLFPGVAPPPFSTVDGDIEQVGQPPLGVRPGLRSQFT